MTNRRHLLAALAALALPASAVAATPPAKTPGATPPKNKPAAKKSAPPPKKKAAKKPPKPRLIITVNKASQKLTVELDGDTLYRWPISTGARGYDTPSGTFRPFRMEKDYFSKEWDNAPMPHAIFFTARGHALHGSYQIKSLGRRASHGCVRIHPDNAAKLFALVGKTGMSNTRIVVTNGWFGGGATVSSTGTGKKGLFRSLFD
jgi:lipoprotein-anchoring transpeptidase ErfK/SrfK